MSNDTKHVTIVLPVDLIERIDEAGKELGIKRGPMIRLATLAYFRDRDR